MTDATVLGGSVDNGRRVSATFTFYTGAVGMRDRGDRFEVSYFDQVTPVFRPGLQGIVDGRLFNILSVATRGLDLGASASSPRQGEMRVVTLTIVPAVTH